MTNLKAGSVPTGEPVQGPQSVPTLGDVWWSSNRRSVDRTVTQGPPFCRKKPFLKFWGPELTCLEGSDVDPHPAVQHAYIYIYI